MGVLSKTVELHQKLQKAYQKLKRLEAEGADNKRKSKVKKKIKNLRYKLKYGKPTKKGA